MRISLGCDHGGYELKEAIKKYLLSLGHDVDDLGCDSVDSADYPDHGAAAARAVAAGDCARGILICKSGIGMSMVGNKIAGARAALCLDEEMAESSRRHNDANVLVLSGSRTPPARAWNIVDVWLSTPFEGGRHQRRVQKIARIEGEGNRQAKTRNPKQPPAKQPAGRQNTKLKTNNLTSISFGF